MSDNVQDRLVRLETQVEGPLQKIADELGVLSTLKVESDSMKKFKDDFYDNVHNLIDQRLERREFDTQIKLLIKEELRAALSSKEVKTVIREEVIALLSSKEMREEFTNNVSVIVESKKKDWELGLFTKIGAGVVTFVTAVILILIESGIM